MATLKYSRQRESIKEFLRTRTDHPTADVVYENMKLIYPNISLGTVYRNLSLLADLGDPLLGVGEEYHAPGHYDHDNSPYGGGQVGIYAADTYFGKDRSESREHSGQQGKDKPHKG